MEESPLNLFFSKRKCHLGSSPILIAPNALMLLRVGKLKTSHPLPLGTPRVGERAGLLEGGFILVHQDSFIGPDFFLCFGKLPFDPFFLLLRVRLCRGMSGQLHRKA